MCSPKEYQAAGETPARTMCWPLNRGGFGLWACLPDPKRALGAHGVPRFGEVRLRRTALTLEPCGARAGYTPPSADVLVLAWCMGHGARDMQGTESGSRSFTEPGGGGVLKNTVGVGFFGNPPFLLNGLWGGFKGVFRRRHTISAKKILVDR